MGVRLVQNQPLQGIKIFACDAADWLRGMFVSPIDPPLLAPALESQLLKGARDNLDR
jgi:hypothetical protein